jgi:hypothetical protein
MKLARSFISKAYAKEIEASCSPAGEWWEMEGKQLIIAGGVWLTLVETVAEMTRRGTGTRYQPFGFSGCGGGP